MGILDRFSDIAKANINDALDRCEDPSKMIEQYLRELTDDLIEVKRETAGIMAEETRAKRLVDENAAQIARFAGLARKALAAGNEDDARVFLTKKQELEAEGADLAEIYGVAHGNASKMRQLHDKLVDDIDGVYVEERTPLVIASAGGYPKDINLYQTSKTLSNARAVVADGGTMILLSECRESFGDADCARQICGFDNMLDRERDLRENFSIGAYVGFLFCESAERYRFIMVTDIPKEKFANTKIHAVKTLGEALALAKELNGGSLELRTTLLPHGANTLPKFRDGQ